MSRFIHLHVHSAYSLAEGAIKTKDLVQLCVDQGMPAVAVTDTNNLFGAMEFATEAAKAGLQPIIGAQVSIGEERHEAVLLVQNADGYRNLCKLIADAYLQGDPQSKVYIKRDILKDHADGLICLSGGIKGEIAHALLHNQAEKAEESLLDFKNIFRDRFYIELQRHEGWAQEAQIEDALIDLAYKHDIPIVATNDCYFAERKTYDAHDALLCISEGRYVSETDRRKVTPDHYFKSASEMETLFSDLPEAIENTALIAQRCSFLLQPISPILPPFETEGGRDELEELEAQARAGLEERLTDLSDEEKTPYFERLKFELGVIAEMGYPGYFLIVSDFIRWAKDHNIPVGPGRGSGAGSVVAWSLKITDLDPLEHGLLFERFLNPERISMPDFDIDFCQERRDEVIRYVQNKYGYDKVAQIITFGKLQARAVVRDVGRVLQMPYGQVDRIAKLIPNNPANPTTLQEALDADPELRAERDKDETQKRLIQIALQLEGLYRHASTHAAGVVIGDRPLHELIPLYRDPRSDMPVTGFNMKYVEEAGLVKFDFLGLKTMTVVQKTVEMVNAKSDDKIELLEIPLDDPKTYRLIAQADTVGIFQLESAGMRDALRKVKPDKFEDIIALISLYRPGPMDNIPTYVSNKEGKTEPDYMHPKLKPILEPTYGIMVYQEQVLQSAQALAGYTLGGADFLRKAMGKKIQEEMDAQREMFVSGAGEHNDVSEEHASQIFDQIAKFAGYGFNKAHAACYALIGYWTAWLKAHHPLEFMAASMTLDLGNTDKLSLFKQELDRMGVPLLQPCVNASQFDFRVEGDGIRYALAALKGVGEEAMKSLVREREENGPYQSLEDFAGRIEPRSLNKRQIEQLAAAGAFEALNENRAQVYQGAEVILRHAASIAEERESGQVSLFGEADSGGGLGMPDLPDVKDWDPLERLANEFSAVGFYLSAHPLDSREQQFQNLGVVSYADIQRDLVHKSAARYQIAGVLLKKQEKVSQRGNKFAFLQLSDPTGIFEVVLFSELLHAAREFLEPGNTMLLQVDAEQQEEQIRFTCQKIEPLDAALEHKIQEIQIHLASAHGVKKLKEFLDIEGAGRSNITLFVDLQNGRRAKVALPGRWSLSAQARNIIRGEKGVKEILEA